MFFWSGSITVWLAYFFLLQSKHIYNTTSFSWISLGFRLAVPSYSMQAWFYANHILCKPLINSTSNDPCYRQVYLCMKIALNIHLTWCAELYIRAIVELEWVNVSENLHDKTGWLHSERFSLILSKNKWSFFDRKIHPICWDQQSVKIAILFLKWVIVFKMNFNDNC